MAGGSRLVLGISAYFHDAAAALVRGGEIVAAAQEERFSRIKHDAGFPGRAVEYCLAEAGVSAKDLDFVVFYEKPLLKFERLLESYLASAPAGFASFRKAIPLWLREKLLLPRDIRRRLGGYHRRILFTGHHEAHAASAFFPSPFKEAAVLTIDGVGEWTSAAIHHGRGNELSTLAEMDFPHSLGLLYSAMTYFCGFRVNSGEYKLMGLAPFGQPRFASRLLDKVVRIGDDGSLWMDQSFFNYIGGLTMTSSRMEELLEGPPRRPESEITRREMDIAASIQSITEEVVLKMARHARDLTDCPNLCLAGGVALNCVANGKLAREKIFRDCWIQPASGDAGGALGAALQVAHGLLEEPRPSGDGMKRGLLGPMVDRRTLPTRLGALGVTFHQHTDEPAMLEEVCRHIADGHVVGWVQGRMEFGPRALGARSILADPRNPGIQSQLNLKIKFRESFRPFAPAMLEEEASRWFEIPPDCPSPYMLLVAPVREQWRIPATGTGLDAVRETRSPFPAITHVDYSARLQTVAPGTGIFRRLLECFFRLTGCPMLVNTSFNIRGEPMVAGVDDAVRCFLNTDMDVLAIEDCLLVKMDNIAIAGAAKEAYLKSFRPD
jgi:carbamoyltransferase